MGTDCNLLFESVKINPLNYAYAAEINATYATQEESKHHVSIRLKTLDGNFGEGHICSGALIASSAVLTAAQCVFNYVKNFQRHPSELIVVMGTQNRYQRMQHTLVYSVTHLYIPSTFDPQFLRNNIAILMLESDVFDNPHVKPIVMRFMNNTYNDGLLSGNSKITSWSTTKKGEPVPSLTLLNASLSHDIACLRSYGKIYGNDMVCVNFMDINHSLCPYDAGAPLLVDGALMGLSSIGNDCGVNNLPAIYIDVRHHYKWIREQIGDGTSQNSSIWGTLGFLIFTIYAVKMIKLKKNTTLD